jgi:hypothetical protein
MLTRAMKRVARDVRAMKSPASFAELRRVVSDARRVFSPPIDAKKTQRVAEAIADAVSRYMNTHPTCMTATLDVGMCMWLTILSTGLAKDGTTVVSMHHTVSQHIPAPSLMSLAPRVQCRAISVAIRQFKSYVFTSSGRVIQSRVFHNGSALE